MIRGFSYLLLPVKFYCCLLVIGVEAIPLERDTPDLIESYDWDLAVCAVTHLGLLVHTPSLAVNLQALITLIAIDWHQTTNPFHSRLCI